MNQKIIPVEAIRERDIDLILLEELATDKDFCRWFVERLELPPLTETDGAWRSISDFGVGETDVFFSYFSGNRKIFVLIENKLDADFQEEQFNRYLQRAAEYKNRGKCSEGYVVLIAPNRYCANQNDFESYVTYEQISQRLESTGSQRGIFRSQLLKIAIEKMRRGYQPVNSEPVQKFWMSYWNYRKEHYPGLMMKKPNIVPHNSDWPMLQHIDLTDVTFRHKLAQGNVDATFSGIDDA